MRRTIISGQRKGSNREKLGVRLGEGWGKVRRKERVELGM